MIVSRYGAAGAPAVGPPHFLPFFADARRLLGLRVLGADAGLFALAGLFAARFGVAAAAGFGEAFGDAFALAAGAAFLPFDFGSFYPNIKTLSARAGCALTPGLSNPPSRPSSALRWNATQ